MPLCLHFKFFCLVIQSLLSDQCNIIGFFIVASRRTSNDLLYLHHDILHVSIFFIPFLVSQIIKYMHQLTFKVLGKIIYVWHFFFMSCFSQLSVFLSPKATQHHSPVGPYLLLLYDYFGK